MKQVPRQRRGTGSGPSYDDSANGSTIDSGRGEKFAKMEYVDQPGGSWASQDAGPVNNNG